MPPVSQGPLFFCQHKPMVRTVSLQASDFQRALGSRPVSRTAHFVLHALPLHGPADSSELSTGPGADTLVLVDDSPAQLPSDTAPLLPQWRLGLVLPKKQARRSVTRSLIRHQAREALRRHAPAVFGATPASGQVVDGWVVRLKTPFDRSQYPSAASEALKLAVRQELDELWGRMAQGGWRLPEALPAKPAWVAKAAKVAKAAT
jgi:ribonuclease P protein component